VYHLVFRSAGGGDDPGNLVAACAAHHHHCIHEGRLRGTGKAPNDVTWELGVRPDRAPLLRLRGDVYLDPAAM
jgi:hypothetical protein